MSFKIKEIAIYNSSGDIRTLPFDLNGVNIISGKSGTGKTSIAEIISYCLGGDFDVKGKIRKVIQWYGVHLKFSDMEIVVCRKAPRQGQSESNDCYFQVGNNLKFPSFNELKGDDKVKSVENFITEKMGIAHNVMNPKAGSTLNPASPALKHSLYYCFLKQSTIANEKILFHRQAEQFVGNYIKLTAPYFIGSVPEDQVEKRIKLAELKRELKKVISEINETERLAGKGTTRGLSLLSEAVSLDLVDYTEEPETLKDLVSLLSSIDLEKSESIDKVPADELEKLKDKREQLLLKYEKSREELGIAQKFQQEENRFSFESSEQNARLKSIELFKALESKSVDCPMCGNHEIDFTEISNDITDSISKLNSQLETVSHTNTKLSSHVEELSTECRKLKDELKNVNFQMYTVAKQSEKIRAKIDLDKQKSKVVGRISLYLEGIEIKSDLSSLKEKKEALELKVESLEDELKFSTMEDVLSSQLTNIAKDTPEWSRELNMEYAGCTHLINFKKLTIEALTESGPEEMSKMGSAQNWLSCHLITYLSLHKWFESKSRPVPSFLFLDQPSQVWFPTEDDLESSDVSDWDAAKNVYNWIFDRADDIENLQLIIVDHVNFQEDRFREKLKHVWRGADALVPYEWLK